MLRRHITDVMSTEHTSSQTATNERVGNRYLHVLVFGSLLVPFVCLPYIPIRRHLLALRRSIHTLSDNTTLLQHELSNTLRKEDTLRLADQLRDFRVQLDTVTKQAAEAERVRVISEGDVAERLRAALDRATEAEIARLQSEETLRREIDILRRRADRERRVLPSCHRMP